MTLYWFESSDEKELDVENLLEYVFSCAELLSLLHHEGVKRDFPYFIRSHMDSTIESLSMAVEELVLSLHYYVVSVDSLHSFLPLFARLNGAGDEEVS